MLEQDVSDIRENLRMERYPNESAVRQGIVQRLLRSLGWPVYDPQVVYPEYTLERRHVDYALCHPASKPRIFIEVKQVGQSDGAERQLFEYAFHQGVPLAILTDGREWSFFLPAGAGSYHERQLCKLDLSESDGAESIRRFERYLSYESVCSEAAFKAAQEDYRDIAREREIQEALPRAWAKLVAEEDEILLEVVAECVEDLCGHKPASDTVARFLRGTIQSSPRPLHTPSQTPASVTPPTAPENTGATDVTPPPPLNSPPEKVPNDKPADVGFTLFGEFYHCRTGKEILVSVFEALAERDPTFIERFVALPKHGSKRRYIAQDSNDLYPESPHLVQDSNNLHRLKSGYWLGTNVSHRSIESIIKLACDVAGISYGTDLKINLK